MLRQSWRGIICEGGLMNNKHYSIAMTSFLALTLNAAHANDVFDSLFSHCQGDEINIQNDGGAATLTSDWGVGDCVMQAGSSIQWSGNRLNYHLRVKTNHTTNRDIFHVQWFWGDRTATQQMDGPEMHEDEDFQEWSGSVVIGGADPTTLSRPVVWWRACC
jgi:hypothetical protein